jgi:hypothetical protein
MAKDGVITSNARHAVARKMLTVMWGMWKTNSQFDENLLCIELSTTTALPVICFRLLVSSKITGQILRCSDIAVPIVRVIDHKIEADYSVTRMPSKQKY